MAVWSIRTPWVGIAPLPDDLVEVHQWVGRTADRAGCFGRAVDLAVAHEGAIR